MKKKLVFYFYINESNTDNLVYKLHLQCLQQYAHVFDEILFVLSTDDTSNISLIRKWEDKLIKLHTKGTISFEIMQNNEYRESDAFKRHVIDKLKDNELVFFGHGKGITNIEKYDPELIKKWIVGMYFYNLNFMDEVEDALINKKFLSYGSFLTKNEKDWTNKYHWFYIGTFMWLNSKKLCNYINQHNIEMPLFCDRFYDEEFLGDIYDIWPERTAYSHNGTFLTNAVDFYDYIDTYFDCLYPDKSDFNEFYEKINKNI